MRAAPHCRPVSRGPAQSGFTIIELMVVVAILALVLQMVMLNMGAMVPKTKLDAESKKLVANIDFLRSEARVQGKRYLMQLDLGKARWRMVLPAEERLVSEQTLEETQPRALDWTALEEGVVFGGAGAVARGIARNGIYEIVFDESGNTADQMVFLKLEDDEEMVWTVQVRGLTGQTEILPDTNGQEQELETVNEMGF